MNVLELLNHVSFEETWGIIQRKEAGADREVFESLFNQLKKEGVALPSNWKLHLPSEAEERVYVYDMELPTRHYSVQNFSDAGLLGAEVSIEQLGSYGSSSYVSTLLTEWINRDNFFAASDFQCVEPNDHMPKFKNEFE